MSAAPANAVSLSIYDCRLETAASYRQSRAFDFSRLIKSHIMAAQICACRATHPCGRSRSRHQSAWSTLEVI